MTAEKLAVVVEFPARDEAATIARAVAAAYEELCIAGLSSMAVPVNADNNNADGTTFVFLSDVGRTRRLAVATGAPGTGEGTNIMAISHAALDVDAERVVVLDGDARSAQSRWTGLLYAAQGRQSRHRRARLPVEPF